MSNRRATRQSSLGRRVTRMVVLSLGGLTVMGGMALYTAIKELLVSQFDQALLTKARTLTRISVTGRTGINLSFTEESLPEFQGGEDAEYYQVWLQNGSVLARSPSLQASNHLPRSHRDASLSFMPLVLPDGRPGRAVALRLSSQKGAGSQDFMIDLTLARSSEDLNRILRRLVIGFFAGGIGLLVLAWLAVRTATRAALRPVDELTARVGAIDADSLGSTLSPETLPVDLQPIAEQINELMARLGAAFARERRFASNAAHELLTPVSELRVASDNALDWPSDPRATAGLAKEACELVEQMEHIVRSLLALSRAEAHLTPVKSEHVDLGRLSQDVLEPLRAEIGSRGLGIECDLPGECSLTSDPVIVRSILNNLLLNAVEYSAKGSSVKISVGHSKGAVEIRVRNRPERVRVSDLDRFCEAFWRADGVRSSREHTGLGLALSQAFAQLVGGKLRFELEDDAIVVATVRIPAEPERPAPH